MRRLPILLVFVLIFALLALVPASAKPDCGIEPKHPSCPADDPDDPTPEPIGGGTVCDPADYPFYVPDGEDDELVQIDGVQYDNFTFQLSGKQAITCIDVISEEGPWEVTITGSGARNVGVIPRDSIASGDSCGGYLLRKQQIYTTVTLSAYGGDMPAATINACGTDDPRVGRHRPMGRGTPTCRCRRRLRCG